MALKTLLNAVTTTTTGSTETATGHIDIHCIGPIGGGYVAVEKSLNGSNWDEVARFSDDDPRHGFSAGAGAASYRGVGVGLSASQGSSVTLLISDNT